MSCACTCTCTRSRWEHLQPHRQTHDESAGDDYDGMGREREKDRERPRACVEKKSDGMGVLYCTRGIGSWDLKCMVVFLLAF